MRNVMSAAAFFIGVRCSTCEVMTSAYQGTGYVRNAMMDESCRVDLFYVSLKLMGVAAAQWDLNMCNHKRLLFRIHAVATVDRGCLSCDCGWLGVALTNSGLH